jgi:hypothetical protein
METTAISMQCRWSIRDATGATAGGAGGVGELQWVAAGDTLKLTPSPPNTNGNSRPFSAFVIAAITEAPATVDGHVTPLGNGPGQVLKAPGSSTLFGVWAHFSLSLREAAAACVCRQLTICIDRV